MIVGIHPFAAIFPNPPAKKAKSAFPSLKLNPGAGQICLLRLLTRPLI
jgi:hypothetical protein